MRTPTPLQKKTPFAIDPTPMQGLLCAHAGLAAFSRALRSLDLPQQANDLLHIKQRNSGFTPGQHLEALCLLHLAGGDCMQDIETLRANDAITKMLGYTVPGQRCLADFLEAFHDAAAIEAARANAAARKQISWVPDPTPALAGLADVQRHLVHAIAARTADAITTATVDLDATIIESHKREALHTYQGTRGYQPLLAVWAETGLLLADEFRNGNVPAQAAPLACAQRAFAVLPTTVKEYFFRGDSACHESGLINWLRDPARVGGPVGPIGFVISARMSTELSMALHAVSDRRWKTFDVDADGTQRQWAEVSFVPSEKSERQGIIPLRYIGIRLLKPQGLLFADGSERRYYAVITNRNEADGGALINWHRLKAGTIEHVHDEVKNGLGGGRLPSGKFGANAAWFRFACIAYNLLVTVREQWPGEDLRRANAKRVRYILVNVTGRFSRDRRKITLHLAASREWIEHLTTLFERFPLSTQPTG